MMVGMSGSRCVTQLLCSVCLQRTKQSAAVVVVGGFSLCETHFDFDSDFAEHPGFGGRL